MTHPYNHDEGEKTASGCLTAIIVALVGTFIALIVRAVSDYL